MATMSWLSLMPAACWIVPEMPQAEQVLQMVPRVTAQRVSYQKAGTEDLQAHGRVHL